MSLGRKHLLGETSSRAQAKRRHKKGLWPLVTEARFTRRHYADFPGMYGKAEQWMEGCRVKSTFHS